MTQSFDELKEENRAKEAEAENQVVEKVQDEPVDDVIEADEELAENEDDESTESGDDESKLESWQQTEDKDDQSGFIPNAEAAKRRKQNSALRGTVKNQVSEIDELKRQLAEAKQAAPVQSTHKAELLRPTRDQYDYDDDKYDDAMEAYHEEKFTQRLDTHSVNSASKATQEALHVKKAAALDKNLNEHYERAGQLVSDGKLSAESFQQSDTVVRKAIEEIFPGQGDIYMNNLISTLNGAGSEKVMYQMGVNEGKLNQLTSLLINDPSGLQAAAFLGRTQYEIQAPKKRRSNAPAPGSQVNGDSSSNTAADKAGNRKRKDYEKSNDVQFRFDLKRQAKKDGINTSTWN